MLLSLLGRRLVATFACLSDRSNFNSRGRRRISLTGLLLRRHFRLLGAFLGFLIRFFSRFVILFSLRRSCWACDRGNFFALSLSSLHWMLLLCCLNVLYLIVLLFIVRTVIGRIVCPFLLAPILLLDRFGIRLFRFWLVAVGCNRPFAIQFITLIFPFR